MSFKCFYIAISNGIPRENMWPQPEGGVERAAPFVRHVLGDSYTHTGDAWVHEIFTRDEEVCCGVWGNTLLLSGDQEMLDKRYEELEGINSGEHALPPESGCPGLFHPGDYGLAASLWGFGIEGETPAADAVMAP